METLRTVSALREFLAARRRRGRVGLAPTMGNLHSGHLALVAAAQRDCETTVASVFVNPLQFGPSEDFQDYPRTLEADAAQLAAAGADALFAPSAREVYPHGATRRVVVSVPALANELCGASRAGHFDGVATVVAKLFGMAQPDRAYFGEKDWQQLKVIEWMARGLNLPVEVCGVPTVRAEDGLALSSRNQYLSAAERRVAPALARTLQRLRAKIVQDARDFAHLEQAAGAALAAAGFDVDYVVVRDAQTLQRPAKSASLPPGGLRALAAARLGRARLIDNVGVP